jgi:hypothetical protein
MPCAPSSLSYTAFFSIAHSCYFPACMQSYICDRFLLFTCSQLLAAKVSTRMKYPATFSVVSATFYISLTLVYHRALLFAICLVLHMMARHDL